MGDDHVEALAKYRIRTLGLYFTDDRACSVEQIDLPFSFYPDAHVTRLSIDPKAASLPKTGHVAAFHSRHADSGLWSKLIFPFVEDGNVNEGLASDRYEKPVGARAKL